MKIVLRKLMSFSVKLLILMVVFLLLQNAQSAINPNPAKFTESEDNFSVIDNVPENFAKIREIAQKYCISIGGDTGVIISADGYVLTSFYDGKAAKYEIEYNGQFYDCVRIGWQEAGGVALYKISTDSSFPYAAISTKKAEIGDEVFTFGNSMNLTSDGFEIRSGRISLVHHFVDTCPNSLIIDANIVDGFGGSGLFDADGKLVGIVAGSTQNMGFTLPIDAAMRFVDIWVQTSGICYRGTIDGVKTAEDFSASKGAHIISVVSKSQADNLGIKAGDIVTEIGHEKVRSSFDFWRILSTYPEGWKLSLTILCGDQKKQFEVELEKGLRDKIAKYSFNAWIATVPDTNILSSENNDNREPAFLGISSDKNLDRKIRGIPIHQVVDGSPAAAVGLIKGDVILTINGQPMYDFAALENFLDTHYAGDEVVFEIMRGKDRIKFKVILAEKK